MLKVENTEVVGWEAAIRGMRNPMNSWDKSDSELCKGGEEFEDCRVNILGKCPRQDDCFKEDIFCIGKNDLTLMKSLSKAGTDHRKFMRMIVVYADITAPLYWWKEYDTYKVGTVANSCSTMHKIHSKKFTLDDFSCEHLFDSSLCNLEEIIDTLNFWRNGFICQSNPDAKEEGCASAKECWWQMIQLLPTSYNQRRTVMLNYEVLSNIYKSRKNHKLDEWHILCDWIKSLSYSELIIGGDADGG